MAQSPESSAAPSGEGVLRQDTRVNLPDGRRRWISITGQVHFEGAPHRSARMAGAAIDITDRKAIETVLRDSEARRNVELADAHAHALRAASGRIIEDGRDDNS